MADVYPLRGVEQNIEIAELAMAQAMAAPEARGDGGEQRDPDLFPRLMVVHILQIIGPRECDAGCAVAPRRHEARLRGAKIRPVGYLGDEGTSFVRDCQFGGFAKTLLAAPCGEFQQLPGDTGCAVAESCEWPFAFDGGLPGRAGLLCLLLLQQAVAATHRRLQ